MSEKQGHDMIVSPEAPMLGREEEVVLGSPVLIVSICGLAEGF